MKSRKNILKKAGVLLIASLMVLSTVVIAGDVVMKGDRASPPTQPVISEVVVDEFMWKYRIDFSSNPEPTIDHYNIYTEIATDVYEKIGEVDSDGSSNYSYIDYTSTPEMQPSRYKISAVDNEGQESVLSNYHQYLFYQVSQQDGAVTINLDWTPYLGKTPSHYEIYRGSSPDMMFLLDTISGSFTSYNDLNVYAYYYYSVKPVFNNSNIPSVEITIKGGLGVSATIKNTGATELTNIDWSITLDGALIFFGQTKTGIIASLPAGQSVAVKDFVIGFGETGIAVSAGTEEASATGTVLLFFVTGVA
jgi:hypothetical protein